MKSRGLILTSLFAIILVVGLAVPAVRSGLPNHSPESKIRSSAEAEDPLTSAAGRRWCSGQPTHWRTLLLQR
jgi:hypothetical protein